MFFKVVYRVNDADKKVLTITKSYNRAFRATPTTVPLRGLSSSGFGSTGGRKSNFGLKSV